MQFPPREHRHGVLKRNILDDELLRCHAPGKPIAPLAFLRKNGEGWLDDSDILPAYGGRQLAEDVVPSGVVVFENCVGVPTHEAGIHTTRRRRERSRYSGHDVASRANMILVVVIDTSLLAKDLAVVEVVSQLKKVVI